MLLAGLGVVGCVAVGLLWPALAPGLVIAGLALVGGMIWDGRDHFIGRRRMRQRRWEDALRHFERFEERLLASPARQRIAWLYLSLYASDGIAVVRNNTGVVLLNLGRLDEAQAALDGALQVDELYAVPHVNLAIIAAYRGESEVAQAHLARAEDLGYRTQGIQKTVRQLLAKSAVMMGAAVDDEPGSPPK